MAKVDSLLKKAGSQGFYQETWSKQSQIMGKWAELQFNTTWSACVDGIQT